MHRFWSRLAVELGKRAGLVSVIGLLVTLILGLGITRLEFATGQDSYLNKSDQVYKDNVAYQDLFGGQAMLTVITMDPGHTVDELFTPQGQQQFTQLHDTLAATNDYQGIITPFTVLEFSDRLVQSPDGNPATSIAGKAILTALGKETPGSPQAEARNADNVATLTTAHCDPVRATHARQPGVDQVPALRQPRPDPQAAAQLHPRRHARADRHASARQRVDRSRRRGRRRKRSARPTSCNSTTRRR